MDIASNLQQFMKDYLQYMQGVSDVFLGENYNDIPVPFNFKQSIQVSVLGNKNLYRDSINRFYKFI